MTSIRGRTAGTAGSHQSIWTDGDILRMLACKQLIVIAFTAVLLCRPALSTLDASQHRQRMARKGSHHLVCSYQPGGVSITKWSCVGTCTAAGTTGPNTMVTLRGRPCQMGRLYRMCDHCHATRRNRRMRGRSPEESPRQADTLAVSASTRVPACMATRFSGVFEPSAHTRSISGSAWPGRAACGGVRDIIFVQGSRCTNLEHT